MILAAIILSSCAAVTPVAAPAKHASAAPPRTEQLSRSGYTAAQVEERSLQLRTGMTEAEVQSLLGLPSQTSSETFGQQTPRPWLGIQWDYKWATPYRWLAVVFNDSTSRLNNWLWIR